MGKAESWRFGENSDLESDLQLKKKNKKKENSPKYIIIMQEDTDYMK